MTNKIRAVLFDLDGTLIDTEPSAARAVHECFSKWEITLVPEDTGYVTGRTWESAFSYLFGKYSIPVPALEAKNQILGRYREIIKECLSTVPGSVEAVQSLAKHYPLGLVSGSSRREILWALEKLAIKEHFQVILGAEDYLNSKPQPDGYRKALQFLNVSASDCLVFEDSQAGIQSARAAGMWVVAVTSTNHFQQDLSLAHFKIKDLQEVTVKWIDHLSFD